MSENKKLSCEICKNIPNVFMYHVGEEKEPGAYSKLEVIGDVLDNHRRKCPLCGTEYEVTRNESSSFAGWNEGTNIEVKIVKIHQL